MKKLAIIRNNDEEKCPFGITIPYGCKNAGHSVNEMEKSEDKVKIYNNLIILNKNPYKEPCIYASTIFADKKSVNCNYGDAAAGYATPAAFLGSDEYTKNLSNNTIDGMNSYPFSSEYDLGISNTIRDNLYQFASKKERSLFRKNMFNNIRKK